MARKLTIKKVKVRLSKGKYAIVHVKNMTKFKKDLARLKRKHK